MTATATAVTVVFSPEHFVSLLAPVLFAPERVVRYELVPVDWFHVSESALPGDAYFVLVLPVPGGVYFALAYLAAGGAYCVPVKQPHHGAYCALG